MLGRKLAILLVFFIFLASPAQALEPLNDILSFFRPKVIHASVEPMKVLPGDLMFITVKAEDIFGISSVTAYMGGIEKIELSLIRGSEYQGIWNNSWRVHSTEQKEYITTVKAVNNLGLASYAEISWSDPPYSVQINATQITECIELGVPGTCVLADIQSSNSVLEELIVTSNAAPPNWGRLNTTHFGVDLPDRSRIDSVFFFMEGYVTSKIGDTVGDLCELSIGYNTTGTIEWTTVVAGDSLSNNDCSQFLTAEGLMPWNVSDIINTEEKAEKAALSFYVYETSDRGQNVYIDWMYFEVNYTYETVPPYLAIDMPENTTYDYNSSLPLNYTVIDENLDKCWYNLDNGDNNTLTDCQNTTFNVSEGAHTLYLFANDTFGNINNTVNVNFSIEIPKTGMLEVELKMPVPEFTTNVIQNKTFVINATIYCRNGLCGNVNGTARYNLTSSGPDTPINITEGDVPLYIAEIPASATKSCPAELGKDEYCNLSWIVNATGSLNSDWNVDVDFQSNLSEIQDNDTTDANVYITSCTVDFTLHWSIINFGALNPSTTSNSAPGNPGSEYNISVNPGSCSLDLYIRGTDMTNSSLDNIIGVGNLTWSNVTNSYDESFSMTATDSVIKKAVPSGTNVTTWYWINVPPVYAGHYNSTIIISGVENG